MGLRPFLQYFVILIVLSESYGRLNPLKDPNICGRPQCELKSKTTKFNYEKNKIYHYEYKMHVQTEFSGSGQNVSELYLSANIELKFPRNCEGLLKIETVNLKHISQSNDFDSNEDSDDTEYEPLDYNDTGDSSDDDNEDTGEHPNNEQLASDIEQYSLRFAYHDGIIGEVCPNDGEPIWVLNFKKGLLSSLQNSMRRFDVDYNTTESDISGTCDVVYELFDTKKTSLLIKKSKDLASCKRRYKTNTILQTTPYDFRQNYAVWPILESDSYCNISVDHLIYNKVSCYERHQLIPFSNKHNGVVTHSKISLTLTNEEDTRTNDEEMYPIMKRSTLHFDHAPSPKEPHGEIRASRELLQQMCSLGFPDIQRGFPDAFINFLTTAKLLSYEALYQLLIRAGSICKENGKNHVLNSLPYIGSAASVRLMKEQIVENVVTKELAHNWMSSLSFLTRPDEHILDALFGLMEYGKKLNAHEFTLGVSAVAHTFCRHHSDCHEYEEVQRIVDYLESDVNDYLEKTNDERSVLERVIVSLKGLGNIGIVSDDFASILREIIENDNLQLEVRLQAVFTHRRLDCHKTKNYFLEIYQNFGGQPEIRIASYLQTMKCPDYSSIQSIKMVLQNEEVNQVGSFVWSHLTNLAKSASPVRVETQGLLVDDDLDMKYKMDIRKFSRNFEHSVFFDEFNFGGNTDTNLIFGTDSYLPRTLSFNFTVDLFGESVNLFEMNTRMQGFENTIESYFGPKGPLNTKNVMDKFANFTKILHGIYNNEGLPTYDNLASLLDLNYNHENDVYDDEDKKPKSNNVKNMLQNKADDLGYDLKYKYNDPRASLGIKVFGNDLRYHTIQGMQEVFMAASKLNPSSITDLLSDEVIAYTKSGIILDISYTVPLSSGIPLTLSALGVSSVDLRVSGLWRNPGFRKTQQLDVEAKFKPSVSVDIVSTMQADFFHSTAGVRVKSNLYSSSSVLAKLKVRGMKLISLHVSLPNDNNEIFSARSELLVMKHHKDITQKGISKRYTNSTCSWPFIDRAVGLKLCAEYSLPDVSNSTKYPSLILSGPVDLHIHLSKADLTAKNFVFEYRSDKVKGISYRSFIFETPGSTIPRIFSGNITNDYESYNVTMDFRHGRKQHSAIGTYKDTENDKRLELSLNIHGQSNLAVQMGMNKSLIRNGALYTPKFFLIVNDEKIAGLAGMIKKTEKNEKLQYDINLIFETKRLQTKLAGFLSRTEASYSTKLNLEYHFAEHKLESIEIEGDWADRSQKGKSEIISNFRHKSSAYPKYNFKSRITLLSALGHVEAKIDFNNAENLMDPAYNMTIKLTFARYHQLDVGKTKASIEIVRPRTNTDVKIALKHEEKYKEGAENNYFALIRYAPNKEVNGSLSIYTPNRNLLYTIDVAMNINVPGFDSCNVLLRIHEKVRKEYIVNFRGTWFSNHAITLKGVYIDRSSSIKKYHQLKLLAQSPSFEDTIIESIYSRDEYEFKFDTQVDIAQTPYGLILRYILKSDFETYSYGEVKWDDRMYWISGNMLTNESNKLTVEIHADKIRDIHLILRGLSSELKKEIGIEIKWDANRDPTQKLALSAELNAPEYKTYDGGFSMTYPERTLSGTFDLLLVGEEYKGNSVLAWSSNDAITLRFVSGSKIGDAKDMWVWVKLNTPFDGWQNNIIDGGFYYMNNLLLLNTSALWADTHKLGFEFMGDYEIDDIIFGCEVKATLNSTIRDIPTLSTYFKHKHSAKRIDTDLTFKKSAFNETTQQYAIKSGWQFDFNENYRNISGSLALKSPYEGYKTGTLVSKFSLNDKKQLKGAADLDLEDKKYTLAVEGHVRKLTDSMLTMNITTPIEKFRRIIGRFGLNEKEKHFVSEIRSPNGALGIEILFSVISSSNFDIRFSLETPLESFEKIIIIGKVNPQTVDLRGGWNKIVVGFVGVSRLAGINDFEYSYKVYTPLEHFEENGFVARSVIYDRVDFDIEMSAKLAKYKIGLILFGKPKPKLIHQLGLLKTKFELFDELFTEHLPVDQEEEIEGSEEDEEEDDIPEDDLISLTGYMIMDLLTWPSIRGEFDVEEIGDYYFCSATLKLPQGNIEIRDRFLFPNYLYGNNTLRITTPFKFIEEIKSILQWNMSIGKNTLSGTEISILNGNSKHWYDAGYFINYTTSIDESDLKIHDIVFIIKTPLTDLPSLNIRAVFELEKNVYRGNITGKTSTTELSVAGGLESDPNYLDISVGILLSAPLIPHYSGMVFLKQDFSEVENGLKVGFEHNDNGKEYKFLVATSWHIDKQHYLNAKSKIETNMLPIRTVDTSILITNTPHPIFNFEFSYIDETHFPTSFKARLFKQKEVVTFNLNTPMQEFRDISMYATLYEEDRNSGLYNFIGNLYHNTKTYQINGKTRIIGDVPVQIDLTFKRPNDDSTGVIAYWLRENSYDKTFYARITKDNRYAQFNGGLYNYNKMNWNLYFNGLSTENQLTDINVNASMQSERNAPIAINFDIKTPWKELKIDSIKFYTNIRATPKEGDIISNYELPIARGYSKCSWVWEWLENVVINVDSQNNINYDRKILKAGISYSNPQLSYHNFAAGTNFNINSIWKFGLNGTVMMLSNDDIGVGIVLSLPDPSNETHRLSGRYRNAVAHNYKNLNYDIKYEADNARTRLASRGNFINQTDLNSLIRFEWGPDVRSNAIEGNYQIIRKGIRREITARIATPIHLEDSVKATAKYDISNFYDIYQAALFMPASNQVANADISLSSFANARGMINCTTPFLNITWLRGDFDLKTKNGEIVRYVKATWPGETAIFDSKTNFETQNSYRNWVGEIKMEIPLATRHYSNIVYKLTETQQLTSGGAVVNYNQKKILTGDYKCKYEYQVGLEKDIVDISLENDFKPIGIHYTHSRKNIGPELPEYDMKHVEIFELRKSTDFNITGEMHIRTNKTGHEYKFIAIHPNRTVVLSSDYDFNDNISKRKSKLQLADKIWIAYNFNLQNLTQNDNESQIFSFELLYPLRNLSADGWYSVTDNHFNSDVELKWSRNPKNDDYDYPQHEEESKSGIVHAALLWRNEPLTGMDRDNQTILLTLQHPSFKKDITMLGKYYRSPIELVKTKLIIDYSDEPEQLLTFGGEIKDLTTLVGYRNFSYALYANHEISEINLDARGSIGLRQGLYETNNNVEYQREYAPLQKGLLISSVNLRNKEIFFHKVTPFKTMRYWIRTNGHYPIYSINGTVEDSPDVDSAGEFYLNIDNKFIRLEVNLTPDATQNLQMIGQVPDSRSAYFDLWRDYEEIRVVDISYYLRMNHSRLITSQLVWRPTLKSEIQEKLRGIVSNFYDYLAEGVDFWRKTIQAEVADSCNDIWSNAKPFAEEFLYDFSGLDVIDNDIEELRVFLNESYQANDFYICSVVNFSLNVLDELAIKDRIQSVPKIIREIVQAMGDSGKALRDSILWLIETMKVSYQKAVDIIGKFLHGESLEHLSLLLEKGVAKYDKFIKDLHLSFIKYVENMYIRVMEMLSATWKRMLQNIEPTILKIAHYIESVIWKISKELFDFLYKRTNEIVESPYFNQVSNFTQDMDHLYRDFMKNDAITNIRKYSVLGWRFLKDKYFKLVPFGKELHDVLTELLDEMKTLQKLESVQFIMKKYNEGVAKLEWLAEEFQFEKRIQQLYVLLRNQFTRFTQTALQADIKYREAKTKFIFDPDIGLIELEQKLPMSWHAFNETPKFEEIPEYKAIVDFQELFAGSNDSIWNIYFYLKPITGVNVLIPPFPAHSYILGSRHYITFDKKFVSLDFKYELIELGKKPNYCSFILARDNFNKNFALIIEPITFVNQRNEIVSSRKISLITENEVISIDMVGDTLRIDNNVTMLLPKRIKDVIITRDADVIEIESINGFKLYCNIQFDYCSFQLSGWYFGKTAGLLGTMNNEIYDEFITSSNKIVTNEQDFVNSWMLKECDRQIPVNKYNEILGNSSLELINLCDSFFKNKHSFFEACFRDINPTPFYEMCLDLGTNSKSNVLYDSHPSQRGACTAALAYIDVCAIHSTPLRVPETCVHCDLINGSYVPEGSFITLDGINVVKTTDVVFIIEAKPCNHNVSIAKSLMAIATSLNKELHDLDITNNRYTVVVFGGKPPFDKARSIVYNSEVFTNDYRNLIHYFNHIKTSPGGEADIFQAISVASKLIFRPGASKTMILLPCSDCKSDDMRLDYSSLLQLLLENGINLHVLMNDDFGFDKPRYNKMIFGMDRQYAFSKNDFKDLKGDMELRKQVRLPKSSLGICAPLAIETNGTVFTAHKLKPDRRNPIKKLTTVFAKRVAKSAIPHSCQTCECTGHNTGIAYMQCFPCSYPNADNVDDYGFNDFPDDLDSSEWEDDDDQYF